MAITPQTELKLLKCPIESDNLNQINFSNLNTQYNYFNSLPKIEVDNFTYQRKDNVIRFPSHIDDILNYNYVMYKNEAYTDKWFYAFITDMKYINDNMTDITIKTDVYQTYQFDIIWKRSFVEREHVNDDTIGRHTVPEQLETGDYISTKLQPGSYETPVTCFVLAVSELLSGISYSTVNQLLPMGLYYIGLTSLQGVKDYVKKYDEAGKGEAVNSVFVSLKSFFSDWSTTQDIAGNTSYKVRFDYSSQIEITRVNYLGNDYIPKNKKLYCYPYSYLQVSNHNGQIVNYKWEDFNLLSAVSDGKYKFNIYGTITPGGSFKAFPVNYKNILNNNDDTICLGKFPIGSFSSDVYTNWLTQNGVNVGLNLINSSVGIVSGGGVSSATSGIMGIASTLGSVYEHSLIPDSVNGNVNSGDVNFTKNLINFEFKRMSIKNEYAEIIDNYFSMYGYKVNTVKIPNITGRQNWNFIKTINANIEGNIPQVYVEELKNIFNTGVTIWHNTSNYLDYSRSNNII